MILTRRSLVAGVASLLAAPAVIRVATLMPVKALPALAPPIETWGPYWMGENGFYTLRRTGLVLMTRGDGEVEWKRPPGSEGFAA